MTDTQAPEAEKPAKTPKVDPTKPCLCQQFEIADPKAPEDVFGTGCEQTTKSKFAQGHDAGLVSFLVKGVKDGYTTIARVVDGVRTTHATPADAVRAISEPLAKKAEAASANAAKREADKVANAEKREQAKATRRAEADKKKAEKAAAAEAKKNEPKATGAEVAAGSAEGDARALRPGEVRIKVGRWEYVATQNADGGVTFTDGKGEVQTRGEGDGYTVLETYQAA